jgi:hypothetical protein
MNTQLQKFWIGLMIFALMSMVFPLHTALFIIFCGGAVLVGFVSVTLLAKIKEMVS